MNNKFFEKIFSNEKGKFKEKGKANGYELFLIIYIVFVILPSIIIAAENLVMNIVLSVILLALVLFFYIDKTYGTSITWGTTAMYTSASQERGFIDYHRTHFWKETDILLSFDIRNFLRTKIREIVVMGKIGTKMRILLLDPQSKYVPLVEKASGMLSGEYAYYVLQIQSLVARIAQVTIEDSTIDITIKFFDDVPCDNIYRMHDALIAYDNKQSVEGEPLAYNYEKDLNGYNFYKKLFDEKWNDGNFCYEKEITAEMVPNMRMFAEKDNVNYTI